MRDIAIIKDKKVLNTLSKVKKSVKAVFGDKLKKIILYGSYARNEQDNESDLDIMLLVDLSMEELNKYAKLLTKVTLKLEMESECLISIMETSYENYNKYLDVLPFYMNIDNEGIQVYGR